MAKKYSRKRRQELVEIDNTVYAIVEFTGPVRDQYVNWTKARNKIDPQKETVEVLDHSGEFSRLLEITLYTVKSDGTTPDQLVVDVDKDFISSMPFSLQMELFLTAGKVCAVDMEGLKATIKDMGTPVDEAKNSSEGAGAEK